MASNTVIVMSHRSVGERVVKLRVGIIANGGLVTEDNPTRNGVIVQEVNESINVRSGRLEHETNRRVGGIVFYSVREPSSRACCGLAEYSISEYKTCGGRQR